MGRHYFANGIACSKCGQIVGLVEAWSWEMAASGQGICGNCIDAAAQLAYASTDNPTPEQVADVTPPAPQENGD